MLGRLHSRSAIKACVNLLAYPQAFGSSGAGWPTCSGRALMNKRKKKGNKGERKWGRKREKGWKDKTKVYTDRPEAPLAIDPREGAV